MNLMNFLNTYCSVQRTSTTIGERNRSVPSTKIFGPYPCRIGSTGGTFSQQRPQGLGTSSPKLYTVAYADIQQGDIVIVNSLKYVVKNAYKPGNDHTECDIERKVEP